jgi:hypothetical protein
MAIRRDPLKNIVSTVLITDAEVRKVTMDAAKEADRMIRSHGDRLGDRVRTAQLQAAKINLQMWRDVDISTRSGIGNGFDAATGWQALFDEGMFSRAGMSVEGWRESMMATSREGIESYMSRKYEGRRLSERVYRNSVLSRGHIDRLINNGLLLGKSAAEIARDVRGFISPYTPGGAGYAAKRLARTEVVNAYHTTSIRHYQDTPWVDEARWNLSGSHPTSDVCNEYAEDSHTEGGEPGVFLASEVPGKPHPNCLCYVTPEDIGLDEFARRFKSGQFNAYIDGTVRQSRVA